MKILKHALVGVDQGRKQGTNPIEILGLLLGKPSGDTIVVMDTYALPVKGDETRVIADDAGPYMTKIQDSLEQKRPENFVGWYHSHPFDVENYSHCHLSATDIQNQWLWQNQSPFWVAIVVDPLRSLAKQQPELGAFRCYPPSHTPPPNEVPDGTLVHDEEARARRWGISYNRYYQMNMQYFMSSLGSKMLDIMSRNNLWIRVLSSSSVMEPENRQRFAERVRKASDKLSSVDVSGGGGRLGYYGHRKKGKHDDFTEVTTSCAELAIEQCKGHSSQITKDVLFNSSTEKGTKKDEHKS